MYKIGVGLKLNFKIGNGGGGRAISFGIVSALSVMNYGTSMMIRLDSMNIRELKY